MRVVMPALFIRLPARMKNGTASSGKLSMPLTMRWITTKGGRLLDSRMKASEAPAMAMATGMPPAMKTRKKIFSMGVGFRSSVVGQGGFGAFEHAVAAAPVDARGLHRAPCHRGKSEQAEAVDDGHG